MRTAHPLGVRGAGLRGCASMRLRGLSGAQPCLRGRANHVRVVSRAHATFRSSRVSSRRSSRRGARVASRAAVDQAAGAADWSNVDPDYLHDSIADKLTYLNDFERSEVYAAIEIAFHAHDGQRRNRASPL